MGGIFTDPIRGCFRRLAPVRTEFSIGRTILDLPKISIRVAPELFTAIVLDLALILSLVLIHMPIHVPIHLPIHVPIHVPIYVLAQRLSTSTMVRR